MITALFGTIGGLGLGGFLGWGLVQALKAQEGFGTFALPIVPLAVVLGLAAPAGVGGGAAGAERPRRTSSPLPPPSENETEMTDSSPINWSFSPLLTHPVRLWLAACYNVTALPVAALTFT